mgnify:CR=1 FL=1
MRATGLAVGMHGILIFSPSFTDKKVSIELFSNVGANDSTIKIMQGYVGNETLNAIILRVAGENCLNVLYFKNFH